MTESEQTNAWQWCLGLFLLPIVGLLLPQGITQLVVPRDDHSKYFQIIPFSINDGLTANTYPKLGAAAYANLYTFAAAASLLLVCAITVVMLCIFWLRANTSRLTGEHRLTFNLALLIVLLAPLLAFAIFGSVDDETVVALFDATGIDKFPYFMTFHLWGQSLGFLVYISYGFGALTVAVAATAPAADGTALSADEQNERVSVIRIILFLTAAMLVVSLVTAKFRFEVGLATLGPAPTDKIPNAAYSSYQTLTSAIEAYWSTVLSLGLALLYVPPVLKLSMNKKKTIDAITGLSGFDSEQLMRIARLAAVLSPPIVNTLIDIVAKSAS